MDTKKESAAKWVDINKVKPWGRNPKRLDESDVARMVRSIERFGWADVIVAREADGEIISGHLRHAAAKSLGMAKVPVRYLPIDSAEAHALAVAVTQHEAVRTFDESIGALLADMQEEGIDLDGLGWSEDELREVITDAAEPQVDDLAGDYTTKIKIPIYEPKGDKPPLTALVNTAKHDELVAEIDAAGLPDDVSHFLRLAAQRHISFHFRNVAEYYCHAPAKVQDLFERSALVIIDYDKAIENGFVKMTERLAALTGVEESGHAG